MGKKATEWNHDYLTGRWDGFDDSHQWVRYAVIGGIVREIGAVSVLDVGCGHGLLRRFLPEQSIRSYTGLDISEVALAAVTSRRPIERFICGNVEDWQPDETYDVIVLSEVIYYLDDTDAALAKLSACLGSGGAMIASIYQHPSLRSPDRRALKKTRSFFRARHYELLADLQVTTNVPAKNTWSLLATRPIVG